MFELDLVDFTLLLIWSKTGPKMGQEWVSFTKVMSGVKQAYNALDSAPRCQGSCWSMLWVISLKRKFGPRLAQKRVQNKLIHKSYDRSKMHPEHTL